MANNSQEIVDYRKTMPAIYEPYECELHEDNYQVKELNSRKSLGAEEALKRIVEGTPIENCIIEEDLEYPLDSERSIKFDVKIHNCIFKGDVRLESLIFMGKVNISQVTFCQKLSLSGSCFKKSANFSRIFKGEVDFSGAIFDREVSFSNSHFKDAVFFSRRVDDEFRRAIFKESAEFINSQFEYTDFERVIFNGDVYFLQSQFNGILDISSANFDKGVEFDTVKHKSQFKKNCKIKLNGAKFHNRLEVQWNDIKNYLEAQNASDLSALVKNYSELGWFDDADNCYLAYKKQLIHNDYLLFLMPLGVQRVRFKRFIKNKVKYIKNLDAAKYLVNSRISMSIARNAKIFIKSGIKNTEIFLNYIIILTKFFLHFLSLILYGHGVKIIWPIGFGIFVLLLSAYIYYSYSQVGSLEEGIKISAKILIATTQVGNTTKVSSLTGFCEWWSIFERFLGWLVMTTFVVVLAKKTLR